MCSSGNTRIEGLSQKDLDIIAKASCSTGEAEAGRSLCIQGLQREFTASQGLCRPCLKTKHILQPIKLPGRSLCPMGSLACNGCTEQPFTYVLVLKEVGNNSPAAIPVPDLEAMPSLDCRWDAPGHKGQGSLKPGHPVLYSKLPDEEHLEASSSSWPPADPHLKAVGLHQM